MVQSILLMSEWRLTNYNYKFVFFDGIKQMRSVFESVETLTYVVKIIHHIIWNHLYFKDFHASPAGNGIQWTNSIPNE